MTHSIGTNQSSIRQQSMKVIIALMLIFGTLAFGERTCSMESHCKVRKICQEYLGCRHFGFCLEEEIHEEDNYEAEWSGTCVVCESTSEEEEKADDCSSSSSNSSSSRRRKKRRISESSNHPLFNALLNEENEKKSGCQQIFINSTNYE